MYKIADIVNRVFNMDCLEFMRGIPDKSIDLVLTDIPYNISQKSNGLRKLDYGEWDNQRGMEVEWIKDICRVSKQTIIVFCGNEQFSELYSFSKNCGFIMRKIIWHKPNPTVLNCDKLYIESTEFAIYGKLPKARFNSKYKHNLFEFPAPHDRQHPTQKPINLFKELIRDTTDEGDIVIDPFLGSGTTAVACKLLKRNFIGVEISPEYCKIAEERIRQVEAQGDFLI